MLTTSLAEHKIKQNELHQQAENYRLVKSFEQPNPLLSRFVNVVGKLLVNSGQQLLTYSRAAH